jgi:AraC-like DNA-binding protein
MAFELPSVSFSYIIIIACIINIVGIQNLIIGGENLLMLYLKADIARPFKFISGGHFISQGSWIHGRRVIDSFEIIIGVTGTAYIQQDDIKYEVKPGNMLLLMPGHVHFGYAPSEEEVSFYWFHFHIDTPYNFSDQAQAVEIISSIKNSCSNKINNIIIPLFCSPSNISKVNIIFNQLLHNAFTNCYTHHGCNYLLTSLLIELSEQIISDTYSLMNESNSTRRLGKIYEWIRVNYMNDISLEDIAENFSYNKDYLSRFFKEKTGVSILEYINLMRISKSKEILYQSDKTIKEIAYTLGFKDEKYFMKLFKKFEHITPTEFRNAYSRTHINTH